MSDKQGILKKATADTLADFFKLRGIGAGVAGPDEIVDIINEMQKLKTVDMRDASKVARGISEALYPSLEAQLACADDYVVEGIPVGEWRDKYLPAAQAFFTEAALHYGNRIGAILPSFYHKRLEAIVDSGTGRAAGGAAIG